MLLQITTMNIINIITDTNSMHTLENNLFYKNNLVRDWSLQYNPIRTLEAYIPLSMFEAA